MRYVVLCFVSCEWSVVRECALHQRYISSPLIYCLLLTAYWLLPTGYWLLVTGYRLSVGHLMFSGAVDGIVVGDVEHAKTFVGELPESAFINELVDFFRGI